MEVDRARYAFLPANAVVRPLVATAAPAGFERVEVKPGSFGEWLRGLPLRPGAEVRAYDGRVIRSGDRRVFAVAELDLSPVDLQQCADSVIRLHAEWLWSRGEADRAGYHFVSGDFVPFARWAHGERPVIDGKRVRWAAGTPRADRRSFREYLDVVFAYASTVSLAREGTAVAREAIAPGDFFVLPGGPGHAVLVLDVARDRSGHGVALLGQGFMPAQDFHVLASGEPGSPWFSLDGDAVDTPFWPAPFPWSALRRL